MQMDLFFQIEFSLIKSIDFVVPLEFLATYLMFETSILASRKLFSRFVLNLLRLPLVFFERTPFGQIMSRCTIDFDMIDDDMIFTLRSTLNALLGFTISFLLIATYLPEIIPVMIVISIVFVCLEVNNKHEISLLLLIMLDDSQCCSRFCFRNCFICYAIVYLSCWLCS